MSYYKLRVYTINRNIVKVQVSCQRVRNNMQLFIQAIKLWPHISSRRTAPLSGVCRIIFLFRIIFITALSSCFILLLIILIHWIFFFFFSFTCNVCVLDRGSEGEKEGEKKPGTRTHLSEKRMCPPFSSPNRSPGTLARDNSLVARVVVFWFLCT